MSRIATFKGNCHEESTASFVTKSILEEIVAQQGEWDYNRQVPPKYVESLPDDERYFLSDLLEHQRRSG